VTAFDPDLTLATLLTLARAVKDAEHKLTLDAATITLADQLLALDEHLHSGGRLPDRWQRS
jgi:hypothetical protein